MGIISSKFLKSEAKPMRVSTAIQTETPKASQEIPDVRSPTADIIRTPIVVDKLNLEGECPEEYQPMPLRNKLLKTLKVDPRSPTIGIYRTPILIEETPSNKESPENFNSPTSVYSCDYDSFAENLMTPIEPSVNVSGFEVPKVIQFGEIQLNSGHEEQRENNEKKSCLKISDKPNTYEAKKLLEEIISDEENFIKKVKRTSRRNKVVTKNNEKSEIKTKARPPLSNITSSTNSPGNINMGTKIHSRNKVFPEFGSENSVTPNTKHVVQWDQNNTVVI